MISQQRTREFDCRKRVCVYGRKHSHLDRCGLYRRCHRSLIRSRCFAPFVAAIVQCNCFQWHSFAVTSAVAAAVIATMAADDWDSVVVDVAYEAVAL